MDLTYRFDPFQPVQAQKICDAREACAALEQGNRRFVEVATRMQKRALGAEAGEPLVVPVSPMSLGLPMFPGATVVQAPFALVLSCSDARAPTEAIFDQSFNNLFVVRIAGNVLGTESLGSIDYAVKYLGESLKVIVVMGHTGCGAVTGAVNGYLSMADFVSVAFTHSLRSLVDHIQIAVRGAARALKHVGGVGIADDPRYREMLTEAAVYLNAAVTAYDVHREVRALVASPPQVVYCAYQMQQLQVRGLPGQDASQVPPTPVFSKAPEEPEDFTKLGLEIARRVLLRAEATAGTGSIDWDSLG